MSLTEFSAATGAQITNATASDVGGGTTYGAIALDRIAFSPTNPRTSHNRSRLLQLLDDRVTVKRVRELLAGFDDDKRKDLATILGSEKLAEFVHSVDVHDVNQPILLRGLPAGRLADTQPRVAGGRRPDLELVAGERRLIASLITGKNDIPGMVKPMTDQEVLEFQLVENLQRDDLHPMEEAEGYERLCRDTGIAKEDIGAKIGKSRSYVYGRLKLLDLCQDARQAFYDGKLDASRALLIARIPDEKLQLKALKEFTTEGYGGRTLSVRECQDWLLRNTMLRLDKAPFKITSETLLPAAGSCRACPKRTGANPELFSDVDGADVCTDPKCYAKKETAHQEQVRAEAEAKGLKVIDGKEARELRPNSWSGEVKGYLDLDQPAPGADSNKPLRKLLGKDAPEPVVFIDPHTKQARHVVPTEIAGELLKEKGLTARVTRQADDAQREREHDAERRKQQMEQDLEEGWRSRAANEVMGAVRAGRITAFSAPVLREILKAFIAHEQDTFEETSFERLLPLWGLPTDVEDQADAAKAHVQAAADLDLGPMLLAYMMAREMEYRRWGPDAKLTPAITQLASEAGVDVDAIQADVKKELKAAAAAALKAEKAAAQAKAQEKPKRRSAATRSAAQAGGESEGDKADPVPPAAGKKTRGRAKRVSAEEARSGIADAMQGIDPASGEATGEAQ